MTHIFLNLREEYNHGFWIMKIMIFDNLIGVQIERQVHVTRQTQNRSILLYLIHQISYILEIWDMRGKRKEIGNVPNSCCCWLWSAAAAIAAYCCCWADRWESTPELAAAAAGLCWWLVPPAAVDCGGAWLPPAPPPALLPSELLLALAPPAADALVVTPGNAWGAICLMSCMWKKNDNNGCCCLHSLFHRQLIYKLKLLCMNEHAANQGFDIANYFR